MSVPSANSEPATAAAQRPAIELSVDDYAQHVLLPRFLRLFEDALNPPLKARLREKWPGSWLKEAKTCMGSSAARFVTEAAPWDTYILGKVRLFQSSPLFFKSFGNIFFQNKDVFEVQFQFNTCDLKI